MSNDPKDAKKSSEIPDPDEKIADETSASVLHEGWLQDEKWSIQIDNNRRTLVIGTPDDGFKIAGSSSGDSSSCGACKSCVAACASGN